MVDDGGGGANVHSVPTAAAAVPGGRKEGLGDRRELHRVGGAAASLRRRLAP